MINGENSFYLIWSPEGLTPPKYTHDTLENAQREANRLASVNPNRSFYVVKALSVHKVESKKLHDMFEDDVPF